MYILLVILLSIAVLTYFIFKLPVFGKKPAGIRLERIKQLPNYRNGCDSKSISDTDEAC